MEVLADSSVWVAHFRVPDERLIALLRAGVVRCHPYVVIELACGTPSNRAALIETLSAMRSLPVATHGELLQLIEQRRLFGRGCGLVDLALLASVLLADGAGLWTLDKPLDALAGEVGCRYVPALHS